MLSKEKLKNFFGPNILNASKKIVYGLVLFGTTTTLMSAIFNGFDYWATGFPLTFSESWGPCKYGQVCQSFSYPALIIDIIIWYLIVCFFINPVSNALFSKTKIQK